MGLNWLITGGCGFIGRNLIKRLLSEGGHAVTIIDNLSVGSRDDLAMVCNFQEHENIAESNRWAPGCVTLRVGDILDETLAVTVCQGADIIVHLAANTGVGPSVENPRQDCVTNVMGTLNYLEAARHNNVKRFVFASSGAPAGECEPPIHEELPAHPVSPYGASKLAGEGYCSAYFRTFKIQTVALRFGNVYGPYSSRKDSVVARFIKRVLEGKPLELYGDGTQTRDFIFIDDLVNSIILAGTKENIGGEIFQIATSTETSVKEVAHLLTEVMAEKGYRNIEITTAQERLGDVKRNFSDTSKASRMLGWSTKTNLKQGLAQTVSWFLDK